LVSEGAFSVANYYASHMVLQCAPKRANIWGHGDVPGAKVNIIMGRQTIATTTVGSDGKWSALLPATTAGGPHTITLTSGSNTIVMNDVMFGDVWICSGQSNMEFNMNQVRALAYLQTLTFTSYALTKGGKLRNVITQKVIWTNQITEFSVYHW